MFLISKKQLRVYIVTDEISPQVFAQNCGRFTSKVMMFLCALAHPRFDDNENCTFIAKINYVAICFK
jgi:hypothetical protein